MYSLGMVLMSVVVGFIFGVGFSFLVYRLFSYWVAKKIVQSMGLDAAKSLSKEMMDAVNEATPLDIHLKDEDGEL